MDRFRTFVADLIAGLLTWGFLEALIEIDPLWGRGMATLFIITDYIVYLVKGYNFITWLLEQLKII